MDIRHTYLNLFAKQVLLKFIWYKTIYDNSDTKQEHTHSWIMKMPVDADGVFK